MELIQNEKLTELFELCGEVLCEVKVTVVTKLLTLPAERFRNTLSIEFERGTTTEDITKKIEDYISAYGRVYYKAFDQLHPTRRIIEVQKFEKVASLKEVVRSFSSMFERASRDFVMPPPIPQFTINHEWLEAERQRTVEMIQRDGELHAVGLGEPGIITAMQNRGGVPPFYEPVRNLCTEVLDMETMGLGARELAAYMGNIGHRRSYNTRLWAPEEESEQQRRDRLSREAMHRSWDARGFWQ